MPCPYKQQQPTIKNYKQISVIFQDFKKIITFAIETVSSELAVSIANFKNIIMRFYDREKEMQQLHEISAQSLDNAQFTVVTGRRRTFVVKY